MEVISLAPLKKLHEKVNCVCKEWYRTLTAMKSIHFEAPFMESGELSYSFSPWLNLEIQVILAVYKDSP